MVCVSSWRWRWLTWFLGQGFVLAYSIIAQSTFNDIPDLREQILRVKDVEKVPMVLVGNKCDLADQRVITTDQGSSGVITVGFLEINRFLLGEALASKFSCKFLEVSAKTKVKNFLFTLPETHFFSTGERWTNFLRSRSSNQDRLSKESPTKGWRQRRRRTWWMPTFLKPISTKGSKIRFQWDLPVLLKTGTKYQFWSLYLNKTIRLYPCRPSSWTQNDLEMISEGQEKSFWSMNILWDSEIVDRLVWCVFIEKQFESNRIFSCFVDDWYFDFDTSRQPTKLWVDQQKLQYLLCGCSLFNIFIRASSDQSGKSESNTFWGSWVRHETVGKVKFGSFWSKPRGK